MTFNYNIVFKTFKDGTLLGRGPGQVAGGTTEDSTEILTMIFFKVIKRLTVNNKLMKPKSIS